MRTLYMLLAAISLLVDFSVAKADNYYVSVSGNDSNTGSINSPWYSVNKAIQVARGGDTIFIRGGNYTESEIWIREDGGLGGAEEKYLTISAYPNEKPVFINANRPFIIDANFVRVQGLDFRNGKEMSIVQWHGPRSHVELLNNSFSGTGSWGAIEASGEYILIQGNIIQLNGNTVGTQGHGIYLSRGSHNIIRGNIINGMTGYGIHIFDQRRSEDAANVTIRFSDLLVEENVIYNSKERAGILMAADEPATIQDVVLRKNIIYNVAGSGIVIGTNVTNAKLYNNTIYGINTDHLNWTGASGIDIYGNDYGSPPTKIDIKNNIIDLTDDGSVHISNNLGKEVTANNNMYWPQPSRLNGVQDNHAIKADPKFVNPKISDFRLQENSQAIDAGLDTGLPFSGLGPDLGALEVGNKVSVGAITLKADFVDGQVILNWGMDSIHRIEGFEIQRSANDMDYEHIGYVRYESSGSNRQNFQFTDKNIKSADQYYYRLKVLILDGSFAFSASVPCRIANPQRFNMLQNSPNPFIHNTEISYSIDKRSHILLTIYNVYGQEIFKLVDEIQSEGLHQVKWGGVAKEGHNLASGLYICQLIHGEKLFTKKLLLLR